MGDSVKKPFVDIRNYTFAFGAKIILDSVSLTVGEGEYLSIIGPNGAGKSTLLKCLIRILHGGHGTITLENKPLEHYSQKELAKLMSFVPQSDARSLPYTAIEFVMMSRYPHLSPFSSIQSEDKKAVHDALFLTETKHLADRHLNTLSGGERQSVYIAAAIAQGARILLLDEPTTFLDPKHESDILTIIKKVNQEFGITIISVTHDINTAVLQSDRIAILKNGAFMFTGAARDIMDNEILETVYEKRFSFVKHPSAGTLLIVPEVNGL